MLAKMGYRFDSNELTDFEVYSYSIIASTINQERERELKRQYGKRH